PPLELSEPKAIPATWKGVDLSKQPPGALTGQAMLVAGRNDYQAALAAQFWAVKNGSKSFYNLACFYARNQDHDAAFYWLQKAATEEGVDPSHASNDDDLDDLRADPRYARVLAFLKDSAAYWRDHAEPVTLVYVPAGHDKTKPSPVLVCLHGRGS